MSEKMSAEPLTEWRRGVEAAASWLMGWREKDPPEYLSIDDWRWLGKKREEYAAAIRALTPPTAEGERPAVPSGDLVIDAIGPQRDPPSPAEGKAMTDEAALRRATRTAWGSGGLRAERLLDEAGLVIVAKAPERDEADAERAAHRETKQDRDNEQAARRRLEEHMWADMADANKLRDSIQRLEEALRKIAEQDDYGYSALIDVEMGKIARAALAADQKACDVQNAALIATEKHEQWMQRALVAEARVRVLESVLRDLADAARNACDARQHPPLTEALSEAGAALSPQEEGNG